MGTINTHKCNKCSYTVDTSAGRDCGFVAVTNTYICRSCNEIVDVCVGEFGKTYTRKEAATNQGEFIKSIDFYKCPKCDSKSQFKKWNKSKRPCPKCDGKMEIDPEGSFIL